MTRSRDLKFLLRCYENASERMGWFFRAAAAETKGRQVINLKWAGKYRSQGKRFEARIIALFEKQEEQCEGLRAYVRCLEKYKYRGGA